MTNQVTRRDFMDGVACAVIISGLGSRIGFATESSSYPPARTGYGGSTPKDFAIAHGIRDGKRYDLSGQATTEHYDMVIIGAGIGGLATAHYLRKARPNARILILDNHDDFGGHARRNEFNVDGRFLLGYGGSESLEGPNRRWTRVARDCVADIGINLQRFETAFHQSLYSNMGLSSGLFFPREVYGADRLVTGDPVRSLPSDVPANRHNGRTAAAFIADCPVSEPQKAALLKLFTDTTDFFPGKSLAQKLQILSKISYRDYQQLYFGLDDASLAMFRGRTLDLYACKTEAVPAVAAWAVEMPGFQGLNLQIPADGVLETDPYIYHFPDGNASLARLFVRELIPSVAPGHSMEDIVTAPFDYSRLDQSGQNIRLRLASTVVALGNRTRGQHGVELLYSQGEKLTKISAGHAVYSGYSAMLPYICSDLGDAQRKAVAAQVKAPLVYVNVAIRNWRSWVKQGVHYVNNPAGFYSHLKLDYPVSLGDYRFPTNPDEPMILHLIHVPWPDGPIKDLRSAFRAARALAYSRSFEEFEMHARDELGRILGPGGFNAERDIAAITVNRWGHGYSYDFDPLFDSPEDAAYIKVAAKPVGRIHFAGADSAWDAYAHKAIDSAHRAAIEITG